MAGLQIETNSTQPMRKPLCLVNALSYLDKEYGINNVNAGITQEHGQGLQTYLAN